MKYLVIDTNEGQAVTENGGDNDPNEGIYDTLEDVKEAIVGYADSCNLDSDDVKAQIEVYELTPRVFATVTTETKITFRRKTGAGED